MNLPSAYESDDVLLWDAYGTSLRVILEDIGEGHHGDYDEADPEDEPLLRFAVERWDAGEGLWEPWDGQDCAYCTAGLNSDRITPAQQRWVLAFIMEAVQVTLEQQALRHAVPEGVPVWDVLTVDRLCQRLSWFTLDWLNDLAAEWQELELPLERRPSWLNLLSEG